MPFPNPETQFQPGWKGGPGRPKVKLLTSLLVEALEKDDAAQAKAIMAALGRGARKGRLGHIKEVLDRVEGKVVLPIEAGISGVQLKWPDDRPDDDDASHGDHAPPPPGPGGGEAEPGEEPTPDRDPP